MHNEADALPIDPEPEVVHESIPVVAELPEGSMPESEASQQNSTLLDELVKKYATSLSHFQSICTTLLNEIHSIGIADHGGILWNKVSARMAANHRANPTTVPLLINRDCRRLWKYIAYGANVEPTEDDPDSDEETFTLAPLQAISTEPPEPPYVPPSVQLVVDKRWFQSPERTPLIVADNRASLEHVKFPIGKLPQSLSATAAWHHVCYTSKKRMRDDEVDLMATIKKDPAILDRIREQDIKLFNKLVHRMSSALPAQAQAQAQAQQPVIKREDGVSRNMFFGKPLSSTGAPTTSATPLSTATSVPPKAQSQTKTQSKAQSKGSAKPQKPHTLPSVPSSAPSAAPKGPTTPAAAPTNTPSPSNITQNGTDLQEMLRQQADQLTSFLLQNMDPYSNAFMYMLNSGAFQADPMAAAHTHAHMPSRGYSDSVFPFVRDPRLAARGYPHASAPDQPSQKNRKTS